MKKFLLVAAAAVAMVGCTCQPKGVEVSAMKTQQDSAEYYIGYSMGMQLKGLGIATENPNYSAISEGVKAALDGIYVDPTTMNMFMNTYIQNIREKAAYEAEAAEKQYFAELAKSNDSIKELSDGIYYKVITMGEGEKPGATDIVDVHYRGTLTDGTQFDSSYDRGQTAQFPLNAVIKGWGIALQQMPVGSKWVIYIPSKLAYGTQGAGGIIGPNSTLIFEVEMFGFEPAAEK